MLDIFLAVILTILAPMTYFGMLPLQTFLIVVGVYAAGMTILALCLFGYMAIRREQIDWSPIAACRAFLKPAR